MRKRKHSGTRLRHTVRELKAQIQSLTERLTELELETGNGRVVTIELSAEFDEMAPAQKRDVLRRSIGAAVSGAEGDN